MTLVPVDPTASTLDLVPAAFDLAQRIARTDFVPTAFRGKPEAVMAAMLTGRELGIGPMQALSKIHVIEGRPSMAAELMRAVVMRAGHDIWVEDSNSTRVTLGGKRLGSERETRVTWTMDDAKKAGLDQRQNWRKYPRAMLLARATGELCRAIFADVLAGISYTYEELTDGDVIDAEDLADTDTETGDGTAGKAPKARKTRKATKSIARGAPAAEPAPEPEPAADVPPLPGEAGYDGPDQDVPASPMTWAQRFAMDATNIGLDDDTRHGLYLAISAGCSSSGNELEPAEQEAARSALKRLRRGDAGLARTVGPDGEVWVLVGKGAGIEAASAPTADLDLEVVFPADHAGETIPGSATAVPPSDEATAPPSPEGSSGTPGPDAGSRPSTPSEGPETAPSTEAAWRRFMRSHELKMADLARIAQEVRPADAAVSMGRLVEDRELAGLIYHHVVGSAS